MAVFAIFLARVAYLLVPDETGRRPYGKLCAGSRNLWSVRASEAVSTPILPPKVVEMSRKWT